ncbi:heme peroxidase 6 [Heterobasidion irregulare TC 32-1]|uniref:Heme peroxidase 6 n=1 Tax=Heterobasidion irregulare (strain TC 32-1) TaxID=747525 RepID=W4K0R2_HETIT|nr:heme peroxidase 6 [Heterobasidion irregulare TC 32-1]ETW79418.1 heme peroxidase 6 [Heterobasidion irregulare TC 32-1]
MHSNKACVRTANLHGVPALLKVLRRAFINGPMINLEEPLSYNADTPGRPYLEDFQHMVLSAAMYFGGRITVVVIPKLPDDDTTVSKDEIAVSAIWMPSHPNWARPPFDSFAHRASEAIVEIRMDGSPGAPDLAFQRVNLRALCSSLYSAMLGGCPHPASSSDGDVRLPWHVCEPYFYFLIGAQSTIDSFAQFIAFYVAACSSASVPRWPTTELDTPPMSTTFIHHTSRKAWYSRRA